MRSNVVMYPIVLTFWFVRYIDARTRMLLRGYNPTRSPDLGRSMQAKCVIVPCHERHAERQSLNLLRKESRSNLPPMSFPELIPDLRLDELAERTPRQ